MVETSARHHPEIYITPIIIDNQPQSRKENRYWTRTTSNRSQISTHFIIIRNKHIKSNLKRITTFPAFQTPIRPNPPRMRKRSLNHANRANKIESKETTWWYVSHYRLRFRFRPAYFLNIRREDCQPHNPLQVRNTRILHRSDRLCDQTNFKPILESSWLPLVSPQPHVEPILHLFNQHTVEVLD